jgi:hypothetical protein
MRLCGRVLFHSGGHSNPQVETGVRLPLHFAANAIISSRCSTFTQFVTSISTCFQDVLSSSAAMYFTINSLKHFGSAKFITVTSNVIILKKAEKFYSPAKRIVLLYQGYGSYTYSYNAHIYISIYLYTVHTCIVTHTYIHTYIHTHTYKHTHTYIHTYTHIYTYIHTQTYIHTYIYTYIHT